MSAQGSSGFALTLSMAVAGNWERSIKQIAKNTSGQAVRTAQAQQLGSNNGMQRRRWPALAQHAFLVIGIPGFHAACEKLLLH
jgi:hypothetical protein